MSHLIDSTVENLYKITEEINKHLRDKKLLIFTLETLGDAVRLRLPIPPVVIGSILGMDQEFLVSCVEEIAKSCNARIQEIPQSGILIKSSPELVSLVYMRDKLESVDAALVSLFGLDHDAVNALDQVRNDFDACWIMKIYNPTDCSGVEYDVIESENDKFVRSLLGERVELIEADDKLCESLNSA
jgi:hypothetical protein